MILNIEDYNIVNILTLYELIFLKCCLFSHRKLRTDEPILLLKEDKPLTLKELQCRFGE